MTEACDVTLQNVAAGLAHSNIRVGVEVLGVGDVVDATSGVLVVGVELAGKTGPGKDGVDPVDHAGGLVDPDLPDALVAHARGVAGGLTLGRVLGKQLCEVRWQTNEFRCSDIDLQWQVNEFRCNNAGRKAAF